MKDGEWEFWQHVVSSMIGNPALTTEETVHRYLAGNGMEYERQDIHTCGHGAPPHKNS